MAKEIQLAVSKYLKKKKESVVVDLYIRDYNKTNFYIALVYNAKIEKFKVLFIPLDVVDNEIDDYVCYQFINVMLVNHILETIKDSKDRYIDSSVRDRVNKMIGNYYIEINTHINSEDYSFKTTKYLPKDWVFFYEVILILFEHVPNVMSGLCKDILAVLDDSEDIIEYQMSIDFDLYKDDIDKVFKDELLDVSYLEKANGMYFGIIENDLVIIDYICNKKLLNLYCTNDDYKKYFYSCLMAIREEKFNDYYKLMVVDKKEDFEMTNVIAKYYLCYGIKNDCFQIIEGTSTSLLPVNKYRDGLVKIVGENNHELEKMIKDI